jgi:hypothetical protein
MAEVNEQVELTISVPEAQARVLDETEVSTLLLHADEAVLTEVLKWNLELRLNDALRIVQSGDEKFAGIANTADQIRMLAFALSDIEGGELSMARAMKAGHEAERKVAA